MPGEVQPFTAIAGKLRFTYRLHGSESSGRTANCLRMGSARSLVQVADGVDCICFVFLLVHKEIMHPVKAHLLRYENPTMRFNPAQVTPSNS